MSKLRQWFLGHTPAEVGSVSAFSLGDAVDPDKRAAAQDLSPIVTIQTGIFSGTRVLRDETADNTDDLNRSNGSRPNSEASTTVA